MISQTHCATRHAVVNAATGANATAQSHSPLEPVTDSPNDARTAPASTAETAGIKLAETEFVSDTFQASDTDLAEVKAGMKLLGVDTLAQSAKTGKHRRRNEHY